MTQVAAVAQAVHLAAGGLPLYLLPVQPVERVYELAMRVAGPAASLAAPFSAKLRRGVVGRAVSAASLREWGDTERDVARPLVWLHAPSVGEAFMAQAILSELKSRLPRLQSAFTFFSPSAERMAGRVGADWSGYLPWDTRGRARDALRALRPDVIAFVRTEIWPSLVSEAVAAGVSVVMVNGVLARSSSRTRPAARLLLGAAYARLDVVGVVSDVDAASFPLLGVPPSRIVVTGDARFDQVWHRVQLIDPDSPLLRPFRSPTAQSPSSSTPHASDTRAPVARSRPETRPWLVAGSTWPADEQRLVEVLSTQPVAWRMVIAPHEPTVAHVAALERRLTGAGLSHARLPLEASVSASEDASHGDEVDGAVDVVVVDRVGVLADLYAVGDVAYVGGGFGGAGLHSVVEPAALGAPVVYGPRFGNAQEAERLAATGGGFVAQDTAALRSILDRLRVDAAHRRAAGEAALSFVRAHLGGAGGSAALIMSRLRSSDDAGQRS